MALKVLMSGASSFTGCHIAQKLSSSGFEVWALLTRELKDYGAPLIKKRLEHASTVKWVEKASFGSDAFLAFLEQNHFDAVINHGAPIKGYRDPGFDYLASVAATVNNAKSVFERLAASKTKVFIHSGSIFEPDEGTERAGIEGSSPAVSIYGVSKNLAWQTLRYFAELNAVPITKIIIPNPVGPFENPDRLVPYFVQQWMQGKVPTLTTPHLVRDNLPAQWLAEAYVEEIKSRLENPISETAQPLVKTVRPSGFAMTNLDFINLVIRNLKAAGFRHECPIKVVEKPSSEPLVRENTTQRPELRSSEAEDRFWSEYTANLLALQA
jgi:UDP-glucose 4-epimerase